MPFNRRASRNRVAGVAGAVLIGAMTITSCSSHGTSNAFCSTIRRGHPEFDSAKAANAPAALAEFDRIAATAPAAVAPDLKFVSKMLRLFQADPATVDPATVHKYFVTTLRVDQYLHRTCGIAIPPRGTL